MQASEQIFTEFSGFFLKTEKICDNFQMAHISLFLTIFQKKCENFSKR